MHFKLKLLPGTRNRICYMYMICIKQCSIHLHNIMYAELSGLSGKRTKQKFSFSQRCIITVHLFLYHLQVLSSTFQDHYAVEVTVLVGIQFCLVLDYGSEIAEFQRKLLHSFPSKNRIQVVSLLFILEGILFIFIIYLVKITKL